MADVFVMLFLSMSADAAFWALSSSLEGDEEEEDEEEDEEEELSLSLSLLLLSLLLSWFFLSLHFSFMGLLAISVFSLWDVSKGLDTSLLLSADNWTSSLLLPAPCSLCLPSSLGLSLSGSSLSSCSCSCRRPMWTGDGRSQDRCLSILLSLLCW